MQKFSLSRFTLLYTKEITLIVVCRLFYIWTNMYKLYLHLCMQGLPGTPQLPTGLHKQIWRTKIMISKKEPEAQPTLRATRIAGACGSLSAIQLITWRQTLRANITQSFVSLDRWSAVFLRSAIHCFYLFIIFWCNILHCPSKPG